MKAVTKIILAATADQQLHNRDILKFIIRNFPETKFKIIAYEEQGEELCTVAVPLTKERLKNLIQDSAPQKISLEFNLQL